MYSVEAESIVKEHAMLNATLEEFIGGMQLRVVSRAPSSLEIDLINSHPSVANALRRILMSEVPTVAIHRVSVRENDTVFPDEYIAHRLGLVPLAVDPEALEYSNGDPGPGNALNFGLRARNDTPDVLCLCSEQIVWMPMEGQEHLSVHVQPGVLICKLAPGNTVDMDLAAEKGMGRTHAKWSPVSLCSYRLMPRILLAREFRGEEATELQGCFSPGVIEIVDGRAVVANPRADSMSREVFRHEKLRDGVKILRESGWFCFTIESIVLDPLVLFRKAILILISKCRNLKEEISSLQKQ